MELLERDRQLQVLSDALQAADGGYESDEVYGGRIVLVSGEAGIGKTMLVQSFTERNCSPGQVLYGACDALFTPRPLGPLYDIARQAYPEMYRLLESGDGWLSVATALLQRLSKGAPARVLIIEDVHWADEATLDLLKFLGRRIAGVRALLILTYRDDELGPTHPLRLLLGDLPAHSTVRLALSPLSEEAVQRLAHRHGKSASGVFSATGGNPFFVTEVLASEQAGVPDTVRDAVLGRAARLSKPARRVLELASIVPGGIDQWLLDAVLNPEGADVAECMERGLLQASHAGFAFRHDLARRAIEDSLPAATARELHGLVLQAYTSLAGGYEANLARLVHHATRAANRDAVLRLSPLAARQAGAAGAHREAVAHYACALDYLDTLPAKHGAATTAGASANTRANLLESLSIEYYLTGSINKAISARAEATRMRLEAGQVEKAGDGTRWLSRLHWFAGNREMAERYAQEAVAILEPLGPGKALAMAFGNLAQLYTLADRSEEGKLWGVRARALAEQFGATDIEVHALTSIGTADIQMGGASKTLEKALLIARQHEMHDHAGRAYANLISLSVQDHRYGLADQYLHEGLAYMEARDLDSYAIYLHGWQARCYFEQGRWEDAEKEAAEALQMRGGDSVIPIPALIVMGHLKVRKGVADGFTILDRARELALPTGELQRIGPLAVARAEAAWWHGDPQRCAEESRAGYQLALEGTDRWIMSALAYWLWRAGALEHIPERVTEPFKLMIEGRWREAAQEWERIGCPYEQALALSEGNTEARLQALQIFERLGAVPALRRLRQRLQEEGIRGVPRGPRRTTRRDRFGLTAREREVVELVSQGLSNAEIGQHMSISPKTVDHHVSAILAKLNIRSRRDIAGTVRSIEAEVQ